MRNFREYHVWKNSHELVLEIYKLISTFPDNENYGIKQQMRRAAYSIPSNFAEGCGRDSDKDFNRFIQICLGSAHELEYFIILSFDLKFLSLEVQSDLNDRINTIKRQLYSLSQKLK